jgi:hypothetical protein
MSKRHAREKFYIKGEGLFEPGSHGKGITCSKEQEQGEFQFSRLHPNHPPAAPQLAKDTVEVIAKAMVSAPGFTNAKVPAGFTYLGQFVDHDLTLDNTEATLGADVDVDNLEQGRSPRLDLDSLYGLGPAREPRYYQGDGASLKIGHTLGTNFPPNDPFAQASFAGFDLPRDGGAATPQGRRLALIPDRRNDENLAVAQVHNAFIRFHNETVRQLQSEGVSERLFERARAEVVKHYQWMLREDFLPRIAKPSVVQEVFSEGRRYFEPKNTGYNATMPVEFSVAAYRIGHSMVRGRYQWNRVFEQESGIPATLALLFKFSGTSGNLSPDETGSDRLPSNWIADWRRLFEFPTAPAPEGRFNFAEKLDTRMVDPLKDLPDGSFGGNSDTPKIERNLAFRNLIRGQMVSLHSGQQLADLFGVRPLTPKQILEGEGEGINLNIPAAAEGGLSDEAKAKIARHTPLWFYILREAEVQAKGEHLGEVGSIIVVETFHRAMEASKTSILRSPHWRPRTGDSFKMSDLLLAALTPAGLNPLG